MLKQELKNNINKANIIFHCHKTILTNDQTALFYEKNIKKPKTELEKQNEFGKLKKNCSRKQRTGNERPEALVDLIVHLLLLVVAHERGQYGLRSRLVLLYPVTTFGIVYCSLT